jgi:type I restriction enzyme, S subunit
VLRIWFYYALDQVRQRAERHAHGGSGLVHVRRGDLQAYEIATPDESEQARIEDVLEAHDARIRTEETYRGKLLLLKKGLMQDLLTGRVRVPVPEEEPELLEVGA